MSLEIVRFECGCIGTMPDAASKSAVLVACDNNDGGPGAVDRNMAHKTFTPLSNADNHWLWDIFNDAQTAVEMRKALRTLFNEVK